MTVLEFDRKIRIKNKGARKMVDKKLGPTFFECRAELLWLVGDYFLTGKGVQMGRGE